MKANKLNILHQIHRYIGVYFGFIFFVVSFSGLMTLFLDELEFYLTPASTQVETQVTDHQNSFISQAINNLDSGEQINIQLANEWLPVTKITQSGKTLSFEPHNQMAQVNYQKEELVTVFEKLHTDLLLPQPFSRYVLGFFSVTFLLAIISGFYLHRKKIKELFYIRFDRSDKQTQSDLHKSLGVWGLPFILMITITGAYLSFVDPSLKGSAFFSYHADIDAASNAFSGQTHSLTLPDKNSQVDFTRIVETAQNAIPEYIAQSFIINKGSDGEVSAYVMGKIPDTLIYFPSVLIDVHANQVLTVTNWREDTLIKTIYGAFTPLHYGSFGGLGVKLLYAGLSLMLCALIMFGYRTWRAQSYDRKTGKVNNLAGAVFYIFPLSCLLTAGLTQWSYLAVYNQYEARMFMLLLVWLLSSLTYLYVKRHLQHK